MNFFTKPVKIDLNKYNFKRYIKELVCWEKYIAYFVKIEVTIWFRDANYDHFSFFYILVIVY